MSACRRDRRDTMYGLCGKDLCTEYCCEKAEEEEISPDVQRAEVVRARSN